MMNQTTDMTRGQPLGLLVRFAVPLLLGGLCQLLYTTADSAIVGRLIGVDAFAAVGAAGSLSWLAVDIILGLTQGFLGAGNGRGSGRRWRRPSCCRRGLAQP